MSELIKFLCFFIPFFIVCLIVDPMNSHNLTEEEKRDRLKLFK